MAKVKTEAEKAAAAEAKAAAKAAKAAEKAAKTTESVEIPLSKAGVMEFETGMHPRSIRSSKTEEGAE